MGKVITVPLSLAREIEALSGYGLTRLAENLSTIKNLKGKRNNCNQCTPSCNANIGGICIRDFFFNMKNQLKKAEMKNDRYIRSYPSL